MDSTAKSCEKSILFIKRRRITRITRVRLVRVMHLLLNNVAGLSGPPGLSISDLPYRRGDRRVNSNRPVGVIPSVCMYIRGSFPKVDSIAASKSARRLPAPFFHRERHYVKKQSVPFRMSRLGSLANTSLSMMDPAKKSFQNGYTQGFDPSCCVTDVQPHLISSRDDIGDHYELGSYGYGKNNVKLLYVRRDDALRHEIREYEVDTHLRLGSQKDYLEGDNRDIIATDSQKNTVYLLAKKHGVQSPEQFGLLLCAHFLYTYKHVEEVNIKIEEYPWSRYQVDGVPHNHAFMLNSKVVRYCQVTQLRNESPRIRGGLKGLRVLKTTQSSFTDFIQDEYRSLPDMNDRIFSTEVTATWDFSTASGVDFDQVWHTVRDCIMENFAGPPDTGVYSPSVQNTLYLAEKCILDKVKQISSIEMQMPNKHYFDIDLSKFSRVVQGQNKEVYLPIDKPAGIIYARLNRKDIHSRL